jgi:hypothetical protein
VITRKFRQLIFGKNIFDTINKMYTIHFVVNNVAAIYCVCWNKLEDRWTTKRISHILINKDMLLYGEPARIWTGFANP